MDKKICFFTFLSVKVRFIISKVSLLMCENPMLTIRALVLLLYASHIKLLRHPGRNKIQTLMYLFGGELFLVPPRYLVSKTNALVTRTDFVFKESFF